MDARQRWTLILTSVASLMVGLDLTVVTTALNTIRLDLGASIAELDWTITAYTLTIGVLLLTAAAVGDRLGRRRVLVAGLAVFTASSAACALAPSIGVLIAARAAQGIGTAMVLPQALALSAAFPPETRGKAMGLFAGITGLAILGGPVIGGVVVQGLAWQWIFWLNVPIGIALIPLVSRYIAEAHGPRTPFDVTGLALSGQAGSGMTGWRAARIAGMVLAGVGVSAAMPAAQNAAISTVRREAIGTASGVYNAMRQVGGAFGIAIASAVFAAAGSFASPAAVSHGVRMALLVTAAISAAGALAGVGLRATRVSRPARQRAQDHGRSGHHRRSGHHPCLTGLLVTAGQSPGCPAAPAAGQAPDDEKHQDRHQRDQARVTAEDAGQHDDGDDGDRRRRHPGGPERSGAGRGRSGAGHGRLPERQVVEQLGQFPGGAGLQGAAGPVF